MSLTLSHFCEPTCSAGRGGHTVREAGGDIYRPGVYLDSLHRMANLPCGTSWDACPALGCV